MDTKNPLVDLMLPIHQTIAQSLGLTSQLGLININQMATKEPALEKAIIDKVGSYGLQLGRVIDAVELLLDRIDVAYSDLKPDQKKVFDEFKTLATNVKAAKKGYTPMTDESINGFLRGMEYLKENNPKDYAELRQRLLNTLQATA